MPGGRAISGHAERRAVGLRRIGGGEHDRRGDVSGSDHGIGRLADAAQAVDRPGQAELRRAEPVDEVAASDLAPLLQHLQHAVHRANPPTTPSASTASRVTTP